MDKIITFLKEFKLILILACLGALTLSYAIYMMVASNEVTVEIVHENQEQTSTANSQIKIDVEGAVAKPGVYTINSGSRMGDVIVMAGGFSEGADLDWVAKSLNLAEAVKDEGKIYIPEKSSLKIVETNKVDVKAPTVSEKGKVNINTASLAEIDSLVGIGEVRARAILDNRPYSKIDDLVSKAKIPQSVYEKIKDQVSVY